MSAAVDPWVITQREKVKYQEQFKALQPQNGYVTGTQAKGFFLQSQLPPLILGQIWALADTDSDGKMNINEFSIACKLIYLKLRGLEIPKALPPTLLASLSSAVGTPSITPTGSLSPMDQVKSVATPIPIQGAVVMPQVAPVAAMPTVMPVMAPPGMTPIVPGVPVVPGVLPAMIPGQGVIPTNMHVAAGMPIAQQQIPPLIAPAPGVPRGIVPVGAAPQIIPGKITSPPTADASVLPAPPTPPQSNPPSRHMSISERAPSIESPQVDWAIKGPAKLKYTQVFNSTDRSRSGFLTGVQARGILVQSKLSQAVLAQIWTLSDLDCDGRLSCEEFILAMYLCDKAMSGEKIPVTLPPDLIPPSFRKVTSRHGSISGSRQGSLPGSRHASISSQGAVDADPLAGLPQTSFEDKRKENFDKGQAELERRRKLLMEQQRKEHEERERKEREEIEKREKARLEAEKKQQEELERQLQKQREIEMEKEEQRKRTLEAKEAARKELEKQRQQEWEQQRIAEMQAQKEREQEKVLKQKAHNQTLNVELSTLNEKIKDLSQKICDTRAGVTNVKSIIDGMRSTRDTQMSEMSQLKARIKEQNQKLLQLTQERAKWDAKTKSGQYTEAAHQEQMNAAFANKQINIKALKGKLENICQEIESKKEDINSNDIQLTETKAELKELITKFEELYANYDKQRNQVLEMKHNKRNETYSTSNAWEAAPTSAWGATETIPEPAVVSDVDTSAPAPEGFVKYRAIYEFSARNTDEISFVPGDIVLVPLEQNAEPGWLAGEINGHTGWFPETYVEKLDIVETSAPISSYNAQDTFNDNNQQFSNYIDPASTTIPEPEEIKAEEPSVETFNGDVEYYIAAYPYESAEAGDLSFTAGEMIIVTKKEGDWWTGTIGSRTGMFPSNYVQKADVGTTAAVTPAAAATIDSYNEEQQMDNNVNGNAQAEPLTEIPEEPVQQHKITSEVQQYSEQNDLDSKQTPATVAAAATTHDAIDESRTQEELDTEVSQINTQQKSIEHSDSFSRPMSRTSSMTPGMRAKRGEIAQVIAPYEATSSEQLSLQRGQLIMVRKKTDSGWWEGELQAKGRRRQIGWFPASYVKILQGGRNSGRNTPVSGSRVEMAETILDKVIALYAYKAQNDDELSFDKDDIISVLGRDEPDWWRGELNGLSGLFPSNYVGPFVSSGKKDAK
ncbi:intersectin-1 isoform X1 [Episyrphus balteatus]|uniref:intersectin-1 isoform X1 n=1 Tax=Episyrphus balteatus TaxID=286459 RepID=UPI0024869B00|nr:intersectin-1 isoform X1 [Episyrphus balteatus]